MSLRIVFLLVLMYAASISGQDQIMADTEVSLLTCESGDELYSTFGHTALRLKNETTGTDIVYNYGTFNFNTPNFYMKFLRGKLPYKLAASTMNGFLRSYDYEERSVFEQRLSLTPDQKVKLVKFLMNNIKKENAHYKYDFFFDNCTSRTINAIVGVTGKLEYGREIEDITFRGMLKKNLKSLRWSEFGIDLIIGAVADRKTNRANQHFLPLYLYRDVSEASVINNGARQNLVITDKLVLDYQAENERRKKGGYNWPLIIVSCLWILEIFLFFVKTSKAVFIYDRIWMWLMAIMGFVMAFMWWGTEHLATKENYNLLWANLLFIPYMFMSSTKIKKVLMYIIIAMCALSLVNSAMTILPQYFLPAFGCISLISILKLIREEKNYRNREN